jgi:signal transduction histidine kinase
MNCTMNAILGFASYGNEEGTMLNQKGASNSCEGRSHLLDLINEILDISRIEANRLQISPEPVSVRDSIHEAVDLAVPLAVKRHIQIVTRLSRAEEQAFVMADRQRFKQILLNLLSNAVKYNYDKNRVIT